MPNRPLHELTEQKLYAQAFDYYRTLSAIHLANGESHLLGGKAALALGRLHDAQEALNACYNQQPAGRVKGLCLFLMGDVMRRLGHVQQAIIAFGEFLEALGEYEELAPLLKGAAHYNRALMHRQAHTERAALYEYEQAIREFRVESFPDYLRMALQNAAWAACIVGDLQAAMRYLTEAEPLCTNPEAQWHQELGEVYLYYLEIRGDGRAGLEEAFQRSSAIIGSEDAVPLPILSHAAWLAGQIAIEMGNMVEAEEMAQQALQLAVQAVDQDDHRCLYDAADLMRKVRLQRTM